MQRLCRLKLKRGCRPEIWAKRFFSATWRRIYTGHLSNLQWNQHRKLSGAAWVFTVSNAPMDQLNSQAKLLTDLDTSEFGFFVNSSAMSTFSCDDNEYDNEKVNRYEWNIQMHKAGTMNHEHTTVYKCFALHSCPLVFSVWLWAVCSDTLLCSRRLFVTEFSWIELKLFCIDTSKRPSSGVECVTNIKVNTVNTGASRLIRRTSTKILSKKQFLD